MREEYFIDEKSIYSVYYRSYPDSVIREDVLNFDAEDKQAELKKFVNRVYKEGLKAKADEIKKAIFI